MKIKELGFDGDIICTTNDQQVLEGCSQGLYPIHYESKKASKKKIVEIDLYLSDLNGFNQKVGWITNCSTSSFALLAGLDKNSKEYKTMDDRLKIYRFLQGREIDRTKTGEVRKFPIHWTKWKRVNKSLSQEEQDKVNFENRLAITKRPMFMRHLYSSYNKKWIAYNKKYAVDSMMRLKIELPLLLHYNTSGCALSVQEVDFVEKYYKYSPFISTDCVMNKICSHMESQVKQIKSDMKISDEESDEVIAILKDGSIKEVNQEKFKKFYELYKIYKTGKRNFGRLSETEEGQKFKTLDQYNKYIRGLAFEISSDERELLDYAVDITYGVHKNDNKTFLWSIFGNEIIDNLISKNGEKRQIPFEDGKGIIELLGKRYSLGDINVIEAGDDDWMEEYSEYANYL